jgi:DNA-binding CsgD family transcriptional regulator
MRSNLGGVFTKRRSAVSVPELSPTEERVVLLSAAGMSARDIASDVGLDERTVEWHLVRAARKLDAATALRQHVQRAVDSVRGRGKEHHA